MEKPINILDFFNIHGLTLESGKREHVYPTSSKRFHVAVRGCTINGRYVYGNGSCRRDALRDYAKKIRGKLLITSPSQCRRIRVPNKLIVTRFWSSK